MKLFKNISYPKITYDFFMSIVALAMAFSSRAVLELLSSPYTEKQYQIFQGYVSHFQQYSLVFAAFTITCFALSGFYKKNRTHSSWNPLIIFGVSSLPTLLFGMTMYFVAPQPDFSRGAMALLWLFSLASFAAPRLVKYYTETKASNLRKPKNTPPKNILIVGGAGYIGSQLSRDLLQKGFRVRVLDSLLFGSKPINDMKHNKNFELVVGDLRNVETMVSSMKDIDAVVHLAGIVGDPACSLDDDFTTEVNLSATSMIAEVCKTFGVERLIFASTCSVYGQSQDGKPLNEKSELNPVSLYAKTKIASENVLNRMTNNDFKPTILRFATLFGLSPRPRFDLAVNILSARAAKLGSINVFGGNQWRPFVHVKDISKAITAVLQAPIEKVGGEVFNIGSNKENHKIIDVGHMVGNLIPNTELVIDDSKEDTRNYNVCFNKFNKILKTNLEISVADGILEIAEAVRSDKITDFLDPIYSNVKLTEKILTDHINKPEDDSSLYKKTSKSLLRQINL